MANRWKALYKERHWDKIAKYDDMKFKRQGFNLPYLLFKAKNVTDMETRQLKWMKARPIAPQTRHPMHKLFHVTGRAWSFLTANIPGEHFVIKHGGEVPKFLTEAQKALGDKGKMAYVIKDIEGCFPNMPKEAIRLALTDISKEITQKWGYDKVLVPNKDSQKCTWKTTKKFGFTAVSFQVMLDVIDFVLDNTFIADMEGGTRKQVKGIPMGDPHSPGMTIGTCAWMEKEWNNCLSDSVKQSFKAARYMDDILLAFNKNDQFDSQRFIDDFTRSECYWKPLTLEDAKDATFLETSFHIDDENNVRYWLKNENMNGIQKVWRYAHFNSYSDFSLKQRVLKATLQKVDGMASDKYALHGSAVDKLLEFKSLNYPPGMIARVCNYMAATSRNPTWFQIKHTLVSTTKNSYPLVQG